MASTQEASGPTDTVDRGDGPDRDLRSMVASPPEHVEPSAAEATDSPPKRDPPSQASVPKSAPTLKPSRLPHVAPRSPARSPKPSRETSPARPSAAAPKGLRSRKNSQDKSPSRAASSSSAPSAGAASVPSAAAVQRALSATSAASAAEAPVLKGSKPSRPTGNGDGVDNTPHWPTSPRLKSPPPATASAKQSLQAARKADSAPQTPSIVVQRHASISGSASDLTSPPLAAPSDTELDDRLAPLAMRSAARGASVASTTLETVEEGSQDGAPAAPATAPRRTRQSGKSSDDDRPGKPTETPTEEPSATTNPLIPESGSESGGHKGEDKGKESAAGQSDNAPSTKVVPRSNASGTAKARATAEGSIQNMTVETETVSSIPQVAVGGGAGDRGGPSRVDSGTVRLKPSTETIRPKKDRKKAARKGPSLNSGTASTKADIFEAKVASAVDEANSTDSEETFVYESNPPEPHSNRPGRRQSRTPSATSLHAMADSQRGAARAGTVNGGHTVGGKRSMKFVNNPYNGNAAEKDDAAGPTTPAVGRGGAVKDAGASHHYHIGQWGRSGKSQHASLFDGESPFTRDSKVLRAGSGHGSRHSSRATSPRPPHQLRLNGLNDKKGGQVSSYDVDVEGADDEGTPLLGTGRVNRSRAHRPPGGASLRQAEYQESRHRNFLTRFAGCLVLTLMVLLVIAGAMGFLFATTKALEDVRVHEVQNVLATEQEVMLDLLVGAVNPNIISVTINDMDVNVFAKSRYVGTGALWRGEGGDDVDEDLDWSVRDMSDSGNYTSDSGYASEGVDEGNDPIEDPEADPQTMLLGRIFEFDSALTLDGSPIKRRPSFSVGEVRLAKPGNRTEEGGTARWERVIKHPFELIVRGVLKYQLPLSSRMRSVPIGGSAMVHPEEGVDALGRMKTEPVRDSPYAPGSNVIVRPPEPAPL
ncbi:MAG: hypothetical protein M1832_003779 [Thelocarpon impressellum]|nr:MAG: hypothetical protein M1832_003779 [Thelocarpon impressellum]